PALDVRTGLGECELDPGERGRDVEHVVVAEVADAEDLALERALAGCERDPEAVAQVEQELRTVDRLGDTDGCHDRRAVVVGREELETHRLDAFAAGAAEPDVLVESRLET